MPSTTIIRILEPLLDSVSSSLLSYPLDALFRGRIERCICDPQSATPSMPKTYLKNCGWVASGAASRPASSWSPGLEKEG
jgi:hypothetical protein